MAWKPTEEEWIKFQKDLKRQGVNVNTSSESAFVPPKKPTQKPQQKPAQPVQNRRKGVMGILDTVKQKVKTSLDPNARDKAREQAQRDKARRETKMLKKKHHYLPQIQKIARRYGAEVEALDTAAYVYKTEGNRQKGVHINYGEGPATISRKLEVAFTKSATSSRVIKGITNAAHKAKAIREELGEAGEAIKGAMGDGKGNMFEDPNFGGAFNAGRSSGGSSGRSSGTKKKRSSQPRNPDQIYPDIKW
jgi:hypothetical protein